MTAGAKRNTFRTLLALHFVGLALLLGAAIADFLIDRQTGYAGLQMLAVGRDLSGVIARSMAFPGFAVLGVTGIAMTVLRYGRRPPLWVWIKVCLNLAAWATALSLVAPALIAARQLAHWSFDHNQLAPLYQRSAQQAGRYGAIVFGLLLLNIPVAVWKPFLSAKTSKPPKVRADWLPSQKTIAK